MGDFLARFVKKDDLYNIYNPDVETEQGQNVYEIIDNLTEKDLANMSDLVQSFEPKTPEKWWREIGKCFHELYIDNSPNPEL